MTTSAENNKRIAKNTLFLYFRMLLLMVISLYTSRVVLNTLGIEDYGIFNVVGGVVSMLGFLSTSLGAASSRFITFSLGKNNQTELQNIFSTVLSVHLLLACIIVILGETLGLYFVYQKLVIPPERFEAALWVYHCSILTTFISIISIPYNSLIIAYERMGAFAYISIIEASLKLLIVWSLLYISYDTLIVYAILYLIVQVIIRLSYNYYCSKYIPNIKSKFVWNLEYIKSIAVYAGWTVNGNLAVIGYTQGINVLLNMFFGPVVNAARGIAVQVQAAVMTFVQNFQIAIRPQIIKSYANKDLVYMGELIIISSKFGTFLMLLLAFPIMLCVDCILQIWLGIVPEHTANFVRIMLLVGIIEPLKASLINAIHATGDIKKFQIYEGSSLLMVVPIAYVLLKLQFLSPEGVMLVYLFVELFTQMIRIWIVLPKVSMSYSLYFRSVMLPILPLLLALFIPLFFFNVPTNSSFVRLFFYAFCGLVYAVICIFYFGITKLEKAVIYNFIKKRLNG